MDVASIDEDNEVPSVQSATAEPCDCEWCRKGSDRPVPFQPRDAAILSQFEQGKRKFQPSWYSTYKWVTLCTKQKKVFCTFCRYAKAQKMMTFSTHSEPAFTDCGFDNYKKALERFAQHEASMTHREAMMKCSAIRGPSIESIMATQLQKQQEVNRAGLLKQLAAMKFLLRQGLELRGHRDVEGNLYQLLRIWSDDMHVMSSGHG